MSCLAFDYLITEERKTTQEQTHKKNNTQRSCKLAVVGDPSALTRISQVRAGAYSFLWQLVGMQPPSLQSASKNVTLSLALESGVLLAVHCHELLSS